ncbi:MAG TPA: undecaprenyldiphospho-muramoylpentapeptide beta-N-acetylglucosaminyltransferase [Bryobacteraceae bacterium]|nr:undecaprenyldiphospho-muramoylpentapeptide beta-N-acetylglucosaminyltransferase [Bryobacteraceae bacterium]
MSGLTFAMAGGGTGGHIIPALAVAEELRRRGHHPFFIGTKNGMESRLVPAAGFEIEWINIGGLQRVGFLQQLRTVVQLPVSVARTTNAYLHRRPAAVFSMGGYVAGPAVLAAWTRRIPIVLMEPNAIPGLTNRRMARFITRALVNFEETADWFPPGRAETTGVPVRQEFFQISEKPAGEQFTLLITGGSRGSRTLNNAARESWPIFADAGAPIRILHQTGTEMHQQLAREFEQTGLAGQVVPFIPDMPAAFASADLIICRAGASTVSELAAAGKPAVLVPFPFAADDHQRGNAEALVKAQAARMVLDKEMNGERLFDEVAALATGREALCDLGRNIRKFARPGAASRAADVLEEVAKKSRP